MAEEPSKLHLPNYELFTESIDILSLNISSSELHGLICGFLCAGAENQGATYVRALSNNKKDELNRAASLALFSLFSISQQQINNLNFEFELLLPSDNEPLAQRAQAFSEWCNGFLQGLNLAEVDMDEFYEEEAQDALQHISEFAELEYESLNVDEEDEKALMEVSEYTRMAVIRLHSDLALNKRDRGDSETTH